MKRTFILAALLLSFAAFGDPLEVQLGFSPAETLPSLPVAMRVSIKNVTSAPIVVTSPMTATATDAAGVSSTAEVSLPTAWSPEVGARGSFTIAAGATFECVAQVDPFFAENGLFYSDLPLWKPGTYSIAVTVHGADGSSGTSNTASLVITVPIGDDDAIWERLSDGGTSAFSSQSLRDEFQVLSEYPNSQYYRSVSPFVLNQDDRDPDHYATVLMSAVQGLPGAYVDGARLDIALRYLQRAKGESAQNDQAAAGEWSGKGRVFAQQLVDAPGSPLSAPIGGGMTPLLKSTAQWQAEYDSAHTGRDGWTEAPVSPLTLDLTADPSSPQAQGSVVTFTAQASGGKAPLQYLFRFRPSGASEWLNGRDWSTTSTWTWAADQAGTFDVEVQVRSDGDIAAGATNSVSVEWLPWPDFVYFDVSPATITGGDSATAQVALSSGAPGPASIAIGNSAPAVASVPSVVTIQQGSSFETFSVPTVNPSVFSRATITATFGAVTRSATLTVAPANASPPLPSQSADTLWIDDSLPDGAVLQNGGNGPLHWDGSQAGNGLLSLTDDGGANVTYTTYVNTLSKRLEIGESLVASTRVDPASIPREIFIRWWTDRGVGCVYWGEAAAGGESGCVNRGAISATGWQRLEIPAAQLALEAQTVSRIQLTHVAGKVWFDAIGKSGTPCIPATAAQPAIPSGDTVWIDDSLPAGASLQNNSGAFSWDSTQSASGTQSLGSPYRGSGVTSIFFVNGLSQPVAVGEKLVFYVRMNECAPPRELLIRWYNTTTGYSLTYWGTPSIGGEGGGVNMGPLPAPENGWARLEVPASLVAMEQSTVTKLDIEYRDGQMWFDHFGKSGTACIPATAAQPAIPSGDTVWIDDSLPAGASLQNNSGTSMFWDPAQSASGTQSLSTPYRGSGITYNFFVNGLSQPVAIGEKLVFYVRLNECAPPRELLIRWYNTTTGYSLTYWGTPSIGGEGGGRNMGPLPAPENGWARLEVPASLVAMEQSTVTKLDIEYRDGQMWFDHFGKSGTACIPATAAQPAIPSGDTVWIDDSLPAGASLQNNSGTSMFWDPAQSASGTTSLSTAYRGSGLTYIFMVNGLSQPVAIGERLVFYVRMNECAPPRELLIRWYNTTTGYSLTYWGTPSIGGESVGVNMGSLPAPENGWARLEVPASLVAMEQSTVTKLDIEYRDGQMWFDHFGKSGTACIPATAAQPAIPGGDTVWIDDSLPAGASLQNNSGTSMFWDTAQSASGTTSLSTAYRGSGLTYIFMVNGLSQPVAIGERLVFYVRMNECAPPRELLIRWYNTTTGYSLTYWGTPSIGGESVGVNMGSLPAPENGWARLEVPASLVAMEQSTVTKLDIEYRDGQMWFDHFGKSGTACIPATAAQPAIPIGDTVWIDDSLPAGASLQNNSGTSMFWDPAQSASGTTSLSTAYRGSGVTYIFMVNGLSQPVAIGDKLVFYVRLNECAPPHELLIRWYNSKTGYSLTYWGSPLIGGESVGTNMGPLPAPENGWARLEVPASLVGMEPSTVTKLDIEYRDGQMWFDRFGTSH